MLPHEPHSQTCRHRHKRTQAPQAAHTCGINFFVILIANIWTFIQFTSSSSQGKGKRELAQPRNNQQQKDQMQMENNVVEGIERGGGHNALADVCFVFKSRLDSSAALESLYVCLCVCVHIKQCCGSAQPTWRIRNIPNWGLRPAINTFRDCLLPPPSQELPRSELSLCVCVCAGEENLCLTRIWGLFEPHDFNFATREVNCH